MIKILVPVAAAALFLTGTPSWADTETETRTEERVEQKTDGLGTQRTRTVDSETETDDGTKSVRREETVKAAPGAVEKKTEETVQHDDDD